jgi:outer membrane protein assembly factor BamB
MSAASFRFMAVAACLVVAGCDGRAEVRSINVDTTEHPGAARSRGWPNVYGPQHNSTSLESNINTDWSHEGPAVLWRREVGTGFSAPISLGQTTILLSRVDAEEVVSCHDSNDGRIIWEYRYPTNFQCKYDYSNGPYSTPVANATHVFAVSAEGQLNCLDLNTGSLVWSRGLFDEYQIPKRDWPFAGSPLLLEDRLILNLGATDKEAGIIAIDLSNGKTIWEATSDGYAHTTPTIATIHGLQLVFVLTFENLVCVNPDNGTVHWQIAHQVRDPTGMNGTNAVSPIVIGDRVCVVSGPKVKPGLRCFRILPDGRYDEPWRDIRLLKSQYTNLVGIDGHLFAFTPMTLGGPTLKCIDIINGKLAWKGKPDLGRGNMLAVGNSIIILGEAGHLASFNLSTEKLTERSRTAIPVLEKPCYTSLALNRGLLFARNEKELVCFDLRLRSMESSAIAKIVSN